MEQGPKYASVLHAEFDTVATDYYFNCSQETIFRSSRQEVFCKKDALKNFAKFTRKYLCQRRTTLFKKRLQRRFFPVNFANFLRTLFLCNTFDGCFWIFSIRISFRLNLVLIVNSFYTNDQLPEDISKCLFVFIFSQDLERKISFNWP